MTRNVEDRLCGALLGTALGDALGLPCEGMGPNAIVRRFGLVDRFHMLGRTGFVSDDTEQTALLAQSLSGTDDLDVAERAFRRALAGWFLRLPWGIGLSTLKACFLLVLGVRNSGRPSAGNGAAMRACAVALRFHDDAERRRQFGRRAAEVTHRDARAVEGALFVGEVVAACVHAQGTEERRAIIRDALDVVEQPDLRQAIEAAIDSDGQVPPTGYVVHTLAIAARDFVRFGDRPLPALQHCIGLGGDTDTIAAILGAWLGALHGEGALPANLIECIHDGPFGPSHLRALASALVSGRPAPRYRWWRAMARNLLLYPVVLAHGFRRLWPW